MALLKQITKTSLLIPYEQIYIHSHHYHKELILEQNEGENNPMYQLTFDHKYYVTTCNTHHLILRQSTSS